MPPHWLQAGPRSRPNGVRRVAAGRTGGVSVKADAAGCAGGSLGAATGSPGGSATG
jgi:hypothetical protein